MNETKLTTLERYFAAKTKNAGTLLAVRIGDFYEFYGADAELAAKEFEITLVGQFDPVYGRISMCGVPYHSVEKYLTRLLEKGYKVALCDFNEEPAPPQQGDVRVLRMDKYNFAVVQFQHRDSKTNDRYEWVTTGYYGRSLAMACKDALVIGTHGKDVQELLETLKRAEANILASIKEIEVQA